MKKGEWTFITNHARVLAYLADHPTASAQEIAYDAGLSIRAVAKIIKDLREGGYVTWRREGRRNRYAVNPARQMSRSLEKGHPVGNLLAAVGCKNLGCFSNPLDAGAIPEV